MKRQLLILPFLLIFQSSFCQISGIINIYTKVLLIDLPCNKITVQSSAGFSVGDTVLLIQMQGAEIDAEAASTTTWGNITDIGSAGHYEFAAIAAIDANEIYLKHTFRAYNPAGSVQLISVPQYSDVTIVGTLTAQAWNGDTGGVLAFQASGIISLNDDINVSGLGFRGGDASISNNSYVCTNTTSPFASSNAYYYAFPSPQSGKKGEGIANFITGKESGKGKNGNGGGGGNGHNAGGAGGSNYGAGGKGGDKISSCSSGIYPNGPGIGGLSLGASYYSNAENRIFMGGGGGGGHQNNFANGGPGPPNFWSGATPGGPGGGIVIIKGGAIEGNGYSILANGTLHPTINRAWGDGGGGGGAGGTVLLNSPNLPSLINVQVMGNKGDDVYDETSRDPGPGGGGGGGVIWLPAPNANIISNISGGTFGVTYGPGTCACNRSAAAGADGAVLTGLTVPEGAIVFNQTCISLPVELLNFSGKLVNGKAKLEWATSSETNNAYFTIEKTTDLAEFKTIAKVNGSLTSNTSVSYFAYDADPADGISYYRLSQTDMDGTTKILGIVSIKNIPADKLIRKIYPIPFQKDLFIELNRSASLSGEVEITIYTILGEQIYVRTHAISEKISLTLPNWPAGIYTIIIQSDDQMEIAKVVKGH